MLQAISAGRTRYREIEAAIGANPTRTLDKLIRLRLIERLRPVTEAERRTRRKIYRITHNLLRFYLSELARYREEIECGLGASIASPLARRLDDFMGPAYEAAFRDYLRRLAVRRDLGPDVVAVGPRWAADGGTR